MVSNDKRAAGDIRGVASIFVVVFSTMIISIIVIGFTSVMIRDQSQASDYDLSQGAYDSATAGVEDAKRSIAKYLNSCDINSNAPTTTCARMASALQQCNSNAYILYGDNSGKETTVETTENDKALDRAYTCVKTTLDTVDYVSALSSDQSNLLPLRGEGDFSKLQISWFDSSDIGDSVATSASNVSLRSLAGGLPLLLRSNWPSNRPAVLRAQIIQYGATFKLTDFDDNGSDGSSDVNTIFMYPVAGSSSSETSMVSRDVRRSGTKTAWPVTCRSSLATGGYACTAIIDLPNAVSAGDKEAYLNLKALYNKSSYKIELLNDAGVVVKFKGVQPEVDSTGRANDIFRRVSARLESGVGASAYIPDSAVDVTSNFCKTFLVTDNTADYSAGACDPSKPNS